MNRQTWVTPDIAQTHTILNSDGKKTLLSSSFSFALFSENSWTEKDTVVVWTVRGVNSKRCSYLGLQFVFLWSRTWWVSARWTLSLCWGGFSEFGKRLSLFLFTPLHHFGVCVSSSSGTNCKSQLVRASASVHSKQTSVYNEQLGSRWVKKPAIAEIFDCVTLFSTFECKQSD